MQMAFSYIVMQALPPTLPQFQGCTNAVSTFANILYGKKKYVTVIDASIFKRNCGATCVFHCLQDK